MAVSVKRYISSLENGLEMLMIGLVTWILTQDTEENVSRLRSPLDVGFCDDAILRKDEEHTVTQVLLDSRLFSRFC